MAEPECSAAIGTLIAMRSLKQSARSGSMRSTAPPSASCQEVSSAEHWFARALASQAKALVLDEPFAGVDQESQDTLAEVFRSLAGRGITLLIVLHELGPLGRCCDPSRAPG